MPPPITRILTRARPLISRRLPLLPIRSRSQSRLSSPHSLVPAQHTSSSHISTATAQNRRTMSTASATPVFSSTYDPEQGARDLEPLLAPAGRWALIASGKGVERSFRFKTFKKTWEFMNIVAAECAVKKHHPEWSNVYNTTFIRWTTHSPSGLSEKDVVMARFCDEQAAACGEVVESVEAGGEGSTLGKDLADRVATEGGDCCVPKKKGTL